MQQAKYTKLWCDPLLVLKEEKFWQLWSLTQGACVSPASVAPLCWNDTRRREREREEEKKRRRKKKTGVVSISVKPSSPHFSFLSQTVTGAWTWWWVMTKQYKSSTDKNKAKQSSGRLSDTVVNNTGQWGQWDSTGDVSLCYIRI